MTITEVPLMMKVRAVMWLAGGDASFKAKLKATVTRGSRSTMRTKRLEDELLALAHMVSTA